MKVARIVVLTVALGSGLAAAVVGSRMIGSPREAAPAPVVAAAPPPMDTVDVLVVNRDVAMGQKVQTGDLSWQPWPKGAMTDFYITRSKQPNAEAEIIGQVARQAILMGEPVREARLMKSDRGFMSVILTPGMRAVAVEVKAASTAGGFILPNDHVDIILTRAAPKGTNGGDPYISETILTNIRVLAIDQMVTEKGEPSVVAKDTATLELSPRQAEQIAQAQQLGTISLVLRSIRDADAKPADAEEPPQDSNANAIRVVRYGVTTKVTTSR
ncbi:Flp pilus assembly protein CpaB [Prosthecomicrobium sp. N25]|uniref:Flp pilus assembly protein CpaB n=1 Tax=Prosthecomicrobium sp. N25 TaxID=3129254 RepID=UPI0030770E7B